MRFVGRQHVGCVVSHMSARWPLGGRGKSGHPKVAGLRKGAPAPFP